MFDRFIAYRAGLTPDAIAVRTADRAFSYAAFERDIGRAATMLRDLSVPPGEPVAIDIAQDYLSWVIVMALARNGIASAPASDAVSRWRIAEQAPPDKAPEHLLIIDRDWLARAGQADPAGPWRDPDPETLGRVMRTSGTTGEAKRIGMDWATIGATARNAIFVHGTTRGGWLPLTGHGTILGFVTTLACWAQGQTALLGARMEQGVGALLALRPDYITLVPEQLGRLLDGLPTDFTPWPMRLLTTGSPLPPALARRAAAQLTRDIVSQYGSTEAGAMAVASLPMLIDRPGVAGHVVPDMRVDILDEEGQALPVGARGRVRISGPRVARGYMDDPANSEGLFADGGFLTNDLGRFQADGVLIVEGRCDDLMNIGGQKILPGWVEAAARGCPGVTDCAAFATPDAEGLEQCWLAVEAGEGFSGDALRDALGKALDWTSICWVTVNALPRNAMGKVARDTLRQAALAQRGSV